jgi:predicted phage terminase large subunit-like protein
VLKVLQTEPGILMAERCRRDFYLFVQEFWSVIVNEPFIPNWHIKYLCKQMEKIAWRVIARMPKKHDLIINVPPGSTKSTIATQMFPAWVWIARLPRKGIYLKRYKERQQRDKVPISQINLTGKTSRFITGSYSSPLSLEHAEYTRDIVRSDKYISFFPEIQIRRDKDLKSNYKLNSGGSRFSTSVGATVTGVHGHFIIIDDPLNPNQSISDLEREKANQWMSKTLSTRKVDKAITVTIVIMQRLHENDVTGFLLKKQKKNVRHICLPGDTAYNVKPRRLIKYYVDGLLDPIRLSRKILEESRIDLGPYGYAGQIGQDPRPREGGMFSRDWFKTVKAIPAGGTEWVRGWDLAATSDLEAAKQRSKPAYTAGVKMKYVDGTFYIGHVSRFRGTPGQVRKRMLNLADQDGIHTITDFPQDPGQAGKAQARDLAKHLVGHRVKYSPESGDKILRADPFSAQVEAGNVAILEGSWNEEFLDEADYFPNGYKDQIDAAVRAFSRLVKMIKQAGDEVGAPSGVKNERQVVPEQRAA